MRLTNFAIYIGIGAIVHALCVGATFDWSSAWTFAWLFAWPVMLIATFGVAIVIAGCVVGLAYAGWLWLKAVAEWRYGKKS